VTFTDAIWKGRSDEKMMFVPGSASGVPGNGITASPPREEGPFTGDTAGTTPGRAPALPGKPKATPASRATAHTLVITRAIGYL
jgi:hypothetical protein